ncbi:Transposon Ty3-G Gag-Pol poly [Paramuricea clavata]|uniref:Transposon Ty3-G Gag-Pol poly n=1 Tax=Paramuricea clavata TaxID=317549 RepID=A0A7D9KKP4_PARCT|nr:Transposon Ty3-G Gag-Pol poly [Paramuricea clavata]
MATSDASAQACSKHLISWCSLFGTPETVVSDRGSQFCSKIWESTTKNLNIGHIKTTAYHPQSNGRVERAHRSLKDSLRSRLEGRTNWLSELPWALLGLHNSPNTDSGISPSEIVFGEKMRQPGLLQELPATSLSTDVWAAQLRAAVAAQSARAPLWHLGAKEKTFIPPALFECKRVLLRQDRNVPSLRPKFLGPFDVVQRNNKTFSIKTNNGVETVSIDRLKPFSEDLDRVQTSSDHLEGAM